MVVVVVVVVVAVIVGYRLARRPRRVVHFCYSIFRCCARWDSVLVRRGGAGWGQERPLALAHLHDAMLEMGWSGVLPHLHDAMFLACYGKRICCCVCTCL